MQFSFRQHLATHGWDTRSAACFLQPRQLRCEADPSLPPFLYNCLEEGFHRCTAIEICEESGVNLEEKGLLNIPFEKFKLCASEKLIRDYCVCNFFFNFYNFTTNNFV